MDIYISYQMKFRRMKLKESKNVKVRKLQIEGLRIKAREVEGSKGREVSGVVSFWQKKYGEGRRKGGRTGENDRSKKRRERREEKRELCSENLAYESSKKTKESTGEIGEWFKLLFLLLLALIFEEKC